MIGDCIYDDFEKNAAYVITRCSKVTFWINKVIASIINVCLYYFIIFTTTFLIGKEFIGINKDKYVLLVTIYITTSIMLIIVYNVLSLMLDFKYSFLIISSLLIISVFFDSILLPGQHSLLLRHVPYDLEHGLTVGVTLIYNLVVSIISVLIGIKLVRKKEIK